MLIRFHCLLIADTVLPTLVLGMAEFTSLTALNPIPLAHDLASKSSLACPIPARLRWHS